MFRLTQFILAAMLAVSFGCGVSDSTDPVINVDEDNAAMNEAIAEAERTFDFFVDNWKTLKSDSCAFKAKVPVDGGGIEHIWFTLISVNQNQLIGVCANEPRDVASLKMGDQRTFDRSEISDWMILDGIQCYGGFTIEVMATMAPKDAPPFEFIRPKG